MHFNKQPDKICKSALTVKLDFGSIFCLALFYFEFRKVGVCIANDGMTLNQK